MRIQVTGLDETIKKLQAYQKSLASKQTKLIQRLGEVGIEVANARYAVAQYDGDFDVEVGDVVFTSDNEAYIFAEGSKVLFVEFGTGTAYPEHPLGSELGMIHGTYGKGQGNAKNYPNGWVFEGELGTHQTSEAEYVTDKKGFQVFSSSGKSLVRTKGNPPANAMYEAGRAMHRDVTKIAKEIFRD